MSMIVFFNDTATTEIYTLSLHDALPIFEAQGVGQGDDEVGGEGRGERGVLLPPRDPGRRLGLAVAGQGGGDDPGAGGGADRESTRPDSRHATISYAALFFKKKKRVAPNR